jgi:trehalose/maltose hydrolase-like predicted phosphorylase
MSRSAKVKFTAGLAVLLIALAVTLCCAPKKAPAKRVFDPWVMTATSPANHEPTYLGNGFLGVRLGNDGWGSMNEIPLTQHIAGLYDGEARVGFTALHMVIRGPQGLFHMDKDMPYRQWLNMKRGVLRTRYSMRQGRAVIDLDVLFYVSRVRSGIAVTSITIRPRRDVSLRVEPRGGDGKGTVLVKAYTSPASKTPETSFFRTRDGGTRVAVRSALVQPHNLQVAGGGYTDLKKDQAYAYAHYYSVAVVNRSGDPVKAAKSSLKSAQKLGAATLISEHEAAWSKLWAADIKIQGDPEAQQVVHSCMFYLLCSARKGSDWSITPTGLSSPSWAGHVFWDADTWMLPALLPQHPDLAKSIVDYRFKTLTGARANARKRGFSGVEFAWESARTGRETIGKPFSEERHVTADAALAQWQYFLATGDKRWLRRYGYPVLAETACYWVSRVKYNKSADRYEILRVMPPDELAEIVDNSVYTNAAAKRNIEIAIEARRVLGRGHPYKWDQVARKMYLPLDRKNRRYIEHAGYKGLPIKQADSELLIYPLELPMPWDVKVRTFDYYKAKLNPRGPAMSTSVHSIIAARLGRRDESYALFLKSYRAFLREPFNVFNEKASHYVQNSCFVTGAAGTLQAVIYGFGGLKTNSAHLSASPRLPKQWRSLEITGIKWQGKTYDLIADQKGYLLRRVRPAMAIKKSPKISRKVESLHN